MTYFYAPNPDLEECLAYVAHPEDDNIIYSRHHCRRGLRAQTLDRTFLLISDMGDVKRQTDGVQSFNVQTPSDTFLSMA
jgi:hypothetical protein